MSDYLFIALCVFLAFALTSLIGEWLVRRHRDSGSDDHSALG